MLNADLFALQDRNPGLELGVCVGGGESHRGEVRPTPVRLDHTKRQNNICHKKKRKKGRVYLHLLTLGVPHASVALVPPVRLRQKRNHLRKVQLTTGKERAGKVRQTDQATKP